LRRLVLNLRNMPAAVLSLRTGSCGGSIIAGELGTDPAILTCFNASVTSSSPCVRARGRDLPPVAFSPGM